MNIFLLSATLFLSSICNSSTDEDRSVRFSPYKTGRPSKNKTTSKPILFDESGLPYFEGTVPFDPSRIRKVLPLKTNSFALFEMEER